MDLFFTIAIAVSLLVVVATLFIGMAAFLHGGEYGRANSNKFMRYRVMTQAVAIAIITAGMIWKGTH